MIGRLQTRPVSTAREHATIGLGIGLSFGGASVLVTRLSAEAMAAVDIATQSINEVAVPVGCSLILFATKVLSKRVT